ncbi:hypothetical protein MHBO_004273 [Bonamia ostreae]|uniref:Uncharacterized protein n=1 Tax=Bonamia ostreae TaxID=126728 RepID=A0ABV2ATJ1_9EUKA
MLNKLLSSDSNDSDFVPEESYSESYESDHKKDLETKIDHKKVDSIWKAMKESFDDLTPKTTINEKSANKPKNDVDDTKIDQTLRALIMGDSEEEKKEIFVEEKKIFAGKTFLF